MYMLWSFADAIALAQDLIKDMEPGADIEKLTNAVWADMQVDNAMVGESLMVPAIL